VVIFDDGHDPVIHILVRYFGPFAVSFPGSIADNLGGGVEGARFIDLAEAVSYSSIFKEQGALGV